MTAAEQIKAARAASGLSQVKAAALAGVPRRTWEDWEAGKRTPPAYVLRLALERLEAAHV